MSRAQRRARRASLVAGVASLATASGAYAFGAFGTPPLSTTTGSAHYAIEVLDYDGDTDRDLIVADSEDDEIEAYPGNGDGTFGAPQSIALPDGADPRGIAVGEFAGDDVRDLAVANWGENTISILRGVPGGFELERTFDSKSREPLKVLAEDLDRDGKTDLVVGNETRQANSFGLTTYFGKGSGQFEAREQELFAFAVYGLALEKMDRGSTLDALVVNARTGTLTLLSGKKNGKFRLSSGAETAGSDLARDALATGDFDGDEEVDAVVAHVDRFVLLRGKGDTRRFRKAFKKPRSTPATGTVDGIEAADFNEDGDLDVALASTTGISVALGDGEGHFGALDPYGGGLEGARFLGSGKLNDDVGVDLVRGAEAGFDAYLNLDN